MHPDVAWGLWSKEHARRVESVIDNLLPPSAEHPQRLHEAMRYAVLGGGKRVRALLAYALIHDDLPCMDDDVLRRGKPTCHVAFGEATALLAGDALQSFAFEALAGGALRDPRQAASVLAHAAGSRGMAGGQAIDLGC